MLSEKPYLQVLKVKWLGIGRFISLSPAKCRKALDIEHVVLLRTSSAGKDAKGCRVLISYHLRQLERCFHWDNSDCWFRNINVGLFDAVAR